MHLCYLHHSQNISTNIMLLHQHKILESLEVSYTTLSVLHLLQLRLGYGAELAAKVGLVSVDPWLVGSTCIEQLFWWPSKISKANKSTEVLNVLSIKFKNWYWAKRKVKKRIGHHAEKWLLHKKINEKVYNSWKKQLQTIQKHWKICSYT